LPILKATAEQVALNPNSEIDAFSGSSAILSAMYSSPVSRVVQQRFADIVRTPVSHFEPVSVLKYSVGDEYSLHTDAFNLNRIKNHEQGGDFGGQRVTTNLIYLLPALEGGETEYPTPKISIKGKVGMAIIHSNSKPNFEEDENSFHIGKPIVSGEKWILRTAVRQFQLYANNKISLNAD
jgi:prolyl 4-hydroxylase